MYRLLIAALAWLVAGCGFQKVHSESDWGQGTSTFDASQTPISATSKSKLTDSSDYIVCLAQKQGWAGAEEFCSYKMQSGRPGQWPAYPYGYPYAGYPVQPLQARIVPWR